MSVSAEALRELHRIHQQITDLKSRIQRGPKQIKAGTANVARLETELTAARDTLKRARVESDEQQLQLKQREAKIADLQRKLNECKTNTEFSALKDQIAAEQQANSVLEDEILDKMDKVERLQAQVALAEKSLEKAKQDLGTTKERVDQQQSGLDADLARVTELLQHAEQALPADFKVEYQRIVKARGEEALAPVESESCGGCYTVLSPQTLNELSQSKPVFCKFCGVLLYLPEDSSLGN